MFYAQGGQEILVGEGFHCHLPPVPDKHLIIGYNLPKSEQYWRRPEIPEHYHKLFKEEAERQAEDKVLIKQGKKTKSFIDSTLERYRRQEWERRLHGVWFMNDGEPTYLTNHHYFYLTYCKFDHKRNKGYPLYYEFSRDDFYITQWCEVNPRSMGYMFIGPRACGKSNEIIACCVNRVTYHHNHRVAFQSKHLVNDAEGVLIQAKTVPLFNNLPRFFKPEFSHGTDSKSAIILTRPSVSGKGSMDVEFGPDKELNSIIFAVGPGELALDTETLSDVFEDEIGKQDPKVAGDIYVRHEVNLKTVFRNHQKIGILRKTSTVEKMTDGGAECHALWKDCDPKKLDGNGYTTSKIHRHLISALDTDTAIEEYIDIHGKNWGTPVNPYGKVNRTIANVKIQNDFDAVQHDLKKLSERMRKSPRNESEAFIPDQSKSIFNIQLITKRLNQIRNEMPTRPYVRGNLYWVGEKFRKVWWQRDDYAGRYNMAWLPDEFSKIKEPDKCKILNNWSLEWGYDVRGKSRQLVTPGNDHLFRVATDPIKYSKTKDPRASKMAIHAFRLYDHLVDGYKNDRSKWESHNFFFEYCERPDDTEMALEDLAMLCIFLGCKCLPEKNIPDVNKYFEDNGLERLLAYPREFIGGFPIETQSKSDDAGMASTPEVIDYYTKRLIPFINKDIMRMPFDLTIEDWSLFDSLSPTKSHLTVSSGFALVHAEKIAEQERPMESKLSDWFDEADNSGVTGVLIDSED